MSDDRLTAAIGRLDRALSRIEAKESPRARAPGMAEVRPDALEQRHRLLRDRVRNAIDRLDRLIGIPSGKDGGVGDR